MFDSTPLDAPQKFAVFVWGFLAGVAAAVVTAFAGLLVGVLLLLLSQAGYIRLGELQGWILFVGLFYGFYVGVVVGLVVWARFCWIRLRPVR